MFLRFGQQKIIAMSTKDFVVFVHETNVWSFRQARKGFNHSQQTWGWWYIDCQTNYTTLHYTTLHYTTLITTHHNYNCNCNYTTLITLHYNYNSTTLQLQLHLYYTTPHCIQQLWVRWAPQPLQPLQKTQLQPPFGPSVDSLCHSWDSQQPTSPIGFLCLKLAPPPCAVLVVNSE